MSELTEKLNVGPLFLRERGTFKRQLYCGEPTQMSLAVAMGYVAGAEMQYEIIQQLDDLPSIYGEVRKSALGVGFHHFGIATSDFDRSVRSEEHTSELQSLMRNSYAVFCLKKKKNTSQKVKGQKKREQTKKSEIID